MTDGELSDSQVEEVLQHIRSMANDWQLRCDSDTAWDCQPGSALAADDRATSPQQTSHLAQAGVLAAVDNLQSLMALTVEHRVVHAFAPATLARAVLECASTSIWLLEPEFRDERVLRSLRLTTKDMKDQRRAFAQMGIATPTPFTERLATIEAIALRAGVDQGTAISNVTSTDVVEAADQYMNARGTASLRTMWQLTSGYAHGRRWSALAFSVREDRDTGDPETMNIRFSLDYRRLLSMVLPGFEAVVAALDLYDRRAGLID